MKDEVLEDRLTAVELRVREVGCREELGEWERTEMEAIIEELEDMLK